MDEDIDMEDRMQGERVGDLVDDDYSSDEDWTDIEDEHTEDSDTSTDSESVEDEEEYDTDGESIPCKIKQQTIKEDVSSPHYILPIGMSSIFWDHFGFPVFSNGDFVTRKHVVCTYCYKTLRFNMDVTTRMRAHLQRCRKDVYRDVALQGLKTPLKRLHVLPNVLLDDKTGEKVHQKTQKSDRRREQDMTEPSLADREKGLKDAMFYFGVESLKLELFEGAGFCHLVKTCQFPGKLPTNESLVEMLPAKYKLVKERVIEKIKSLKEYSMSIEEWTDDEEICYLTFSVNHIQKTELVNRVLITVPKNLTELPMHLQTLETEWGINQNLVTAIVTNSDINFADFWASEAQTQFIPCFQETLKCAVKNCLFKLPPVAALLKKLFKNLNLETLSDIESFLFELEEAHDDVKPFKLTNSERITFDHLMHVVGPLKVSLDTIDFEMPVALMSLLWPILTQLQSQYFEPCETDDPHLAQMKKVVIDYIMAAYDPVQPFLHTVSLLDPRFRLLDMVPETDETRNHILKNVASIIEKKPCLKKGEKASKSDPKIQSEVEYVANFRTEQPSDFLINPLLWWEVSNADQLYPNLKLLAKKLVCVPISCVAKREINDEPYFRSQRAKIPYFKLDQMLFLNSNFGPEFLH